MGTTEDLADALARDAIAAAARLGDETLIDDIGRALGASSTTTQEAYNTAVRVRLAEQRARQMLDQRLAKAGPAT